MCVCVCVRVFARVCIALLCTLAIPGGLGLLFLPRVTITHLEPGVGIPFPPRPHTLHFRAERLLSELPSAWTPRGCTLLGPSGPLRRGWAVPWLWGTFPQAAPSP